MRILYLGDIFGETSVRVIAENLNRIKKEYNINLVFANGENVSKGKGLIKRDYTNLMKAGIQALSMGNHAFSKSDIFTYIDNANICRPANLYDAPGKEYITINYNGFKITIINLLGRVFMNGALDCPFRTFDRIYENLDSDYIIVDFHGEATSEKIAFAYYVSGRANAVLGSHTHVQTADERVIDDKTLFISDMGMCGPYESVLGDSIDQILDRFITGIYHPADVAISDTILSGVILYTNTNTITRFKEIIKE